MARMQPLLTGTIRDAATLIADGVAHDFDVPTLLRTAAREIDELRGAKADIIAENTRLRHGLDDHA